MKILYTGIGSNKNGIHEEKEFLKIMEKEIVNKKIEYYFKVQFKDYILPDDFVFFNLNDWIQFSGAEILCE